MLKGSDNEMKSRNENKKPTKTNDPVVLIVPKEQQTNEVTKKIVPITNIRHASKGSIIMDGKSKEDVEQIKKCSEEVLGDAYNNKMTKLGQRPIKIGRISEKLKDDVLVEKIRRQNQYLKDAQLKEIYNINKLKLKLMVMVRTLRRS